MPNMAKNKISKRPKGFPNKHIHARVSYLYQAANYLALHQLTNTPTAPVLTSSTEPSPASTSQQSAIGSVPLHHTQPSTSTARTTRTPGLPHRLTAHLRTVARKSQVRLARPLKRSLCKRCDAPLIAGRTSRARVENPSRGGRKPWADVLIVECDACGAAKRFPIGGMQRPGTRDERPGSGIGDATLANERGEDIAEIRECEQVEVRIDKDGRAGGQACESAS